MGVSEQRGHDVIRVSTHFGTGTPDETIATAAASMGALVITWNRSHFLGLHKKLQHRLPLLILHGIVGQEESRLEKFIDEIEWYYERFTSGRIDCLCLEIGRAFLKDHR